MALVGERELELPCCNNCLISWQKFLVVLCYQDILVVSWVVVRGSFYQKVEGSSQSASRLGPLLSLELGEGERGLQ